MEKNLRLLVVEDNQSDSDLLIRRLQKDGFDITWKRVDNEKDFLDALTACEFDLVIADWFIPQFGGQRALQLLRSLQIDIPFIIVSGTIDEETAVSALRHGASDYLLKDRPDRLGQAVRNALDQKLLLDEKKKADDILRLQSAALNAAANAIVITDRAGGIEWVNEAFIRLTGYSRMECIGEQIDGLVKSGLQNEDFYRDMWKTILMGQVWHGEMVNRRKDGRLYDEEQTITPLFDENGNLSRFIAIKQDITERKKIDAALNDRQERYRALFVESHVVLLLIEPSSGKIIDANEQAAHYYGWSIEELKKMKISDINTLPQEEIQREMQKAQREQRHSFYFCHRKKNGEVRDVEVFSGPMTLEGKTYLYSIVHDISERAKAEKALRDQEKMIRAVFETVPVGIFLLNKAGYVTMYNPAGGEIWQIEFNKKNINRFSDYTGWWLSSGKPIQTEEWGGIRALCTGNAFLNEEIEIESFKGERKIISHSAVPIFDSDGDANGAVVVLQDISEQKKSEEMLRAASQDLQKAYDATLRGWSKALELRERETAGHSQRVVAYALEIARRMGVPEIELVHLQRGALLHDIGKMGIPDHILLKPGSLTEDEWVIMRQHPEYAYNLLSDIPYLLPALDIPYCHHERWDGSGYPRGLKGEEIPLAARIFSVVDVWDALSCDRPYRPAWDQESVVQYILEQAEKQFDPRVVDVFMQIIQG